ncbi:unnamed protein product [Discosporangium mesarthrocarpum]
MMTLQAIKAAYEAENGMSLMRAIDKETSGNYKRALLSLLFPSQEAYVAYGIFKSFEGMGTNERRLSRLLGGTDKKKIFKVNDYYVETYGSTIKEDLKEESSGNFRKACTFWVGGDDPTGGLEYVTEVPLEDEEDEDALKDRAKALLQERTNILDFICQVDAGDVRDACKGLGTSDKRLISVICGRTKSHLHRVDEYYHSLFNMSLEQQIKRETHGSYEKFMRYTLMAEEDFDAYMLKKAMDGLGTNESLIISVLAPKSNESILAARERHDTKYNESLMDRLKSELHGATEDCVLELIKGERDTSEEVSREGPSDSSD